MNYYQSRSFFPSKLLPGHAETALAPHFQKAVVYIPCCVELQALPDGGSYAAPAHTAGFPEQVFRDEQGHFLHFRFGHEENMPY